MGAQAFYALPNLESVSIADNASVGQAAFIGIVICGSETGLQSIGSQCHRFLKHDAIATALLGNSNPLGAILSSMLITLFQNGSNYMSSVLGVAKEIASVITGILLLFSACGGYFRYVSAAYLDRLADYKHTQEKQEKEAKGGADK